MKSQKTMVTIFLLMASIVQLYADAQVRPKTSGEKEFYKTIIEACSQAVESINLSWTQDRNSGWRQNDNISQGSESSYLTHYVRVEWNDNLKIESARQNTQQQLAAVMQKMKQTDNSAATKMLEDLAKKVGAAAEAGDFKEVARLQKEAEKVSMQIKDQLEPSKQMLENVIKDNAPRDASLKIRIAVNLFQESFAEPPKIGRLKNGINFYRVENGRFLHEKWLEGTTYVFLGNNWQQKENDGNPEMCFVAEANEAHTTIKSMIIEVEAAEQRALKALEEMNLKVLQDLINKSF